MSIVQTNSLFKNACNISDRHRLTAWFQYHQSDIGNTWQQKIMVQQYDLEI